MIFITTASGVKHERWADDLERTFIEHEWPTLIVAKGSENPEVDTLWKGRGMKTQFARFIPDEYEGPVAFLDCDCKVIGPYPGNVEVPAGGVSCHVLNSRRSPYKGTVHRVASSFLAFAEVSTARKVSEAWYESLKNMKNAVSDEPALGRILDNMPVVDNSWYHEPMENLRHLAAGGASSSGS